MAVDSTHPEYDKFLDKQTKTRDAYEGEEAVKAKTSRYLPLLSGMITSGTKYKAYLSRAMFYSASRRTIDGLAGIIDRKPPIINISNGLPWEGDIDGTGKELRSFINQITTEAVMIGWQGILTDVRNDYEYPYPVQYKAEQIINWRFDNQKLVMVMLAETVLVYDDYEAKPVEQWRELVIVDNRYTVLLWRKQQAAKNGEEFYLYDGFSPTIRGEALTEIPFVFVSVNGQIENPPLLDMINVNFHHYTNSADYEHGLHFTGLPTPFIAGLRPVADENGNVEPIELGSETCLLADDPQATASFMEFSGSGLTSLVTAMDNKKLEMASLGARLLQNDKKAAETAETARINKSGDSNVMARIVTSVERGINTTLSMMAIWQSAQAGDNTVEINKDFVDEGMSPQELTALVGAWQSGLMSKETAVYNMQKKDMLPDGRTIEEEINASDSAAPNLNG